MHSSVYSFALLIGLTACSYQIPCLAKEKHSRAFHNDKKNKDLSFWSTPEGIEKIFLLPPVKGFLHDLNSDLNITNYKYFCVNSQSYPNPLGGGGGISSRNLSITDNSGPVIFRENYSYHSGAAIRSNNCTISNNRNLCCFINNAASPNNNNSTNGGAIDANEINISHNFGPIQFINNTTRGNGGAIKALNLRITNNFGEILFRNNKCLLASSNGGCVDAAQILSIENNHAPITFIDNQAGKNGCFVSRNCTISNNSGVIQFINNYGHAPTGGSGGGAISCEDTCTISNNLQGVIFSNNSSRQNGGGIFTKNLIIKDNGPVLFLNNYSKWGGAIQNRTRGSSFYLSADYGDIIFNENINSQDDGVRRNALHSTPELTLKIGAREKFRVAFYDTIENEHPSSTGITFNPESYHLGTVLFSGATVSPSSQLQKDYTSFLRNTTVIAYGTLAVEDKAALAIFNLTQQEGTLRLGNKAVVMTTAQAGQNGTTANCTITLKRLALNLPSLLKEGAEAPKIWIYPSGSGSNYTEDTNPTITISGDLSLVNSDNVPPYDSLDLSKSITKIPFLYLCENATKKITVTDLNIEAINDLQHYGYQGVWSPYWEHYTTTAVNTSPLTANTAHRILYADWTPTNYIPDPQYRGDLVANALWQSAYDCITGLHTLNCSPLSIGKNEIGGGTLGAYVSQKNRKSIPGFSLFSKGYSTKALGSSETHHVFALSFAQFHSEIKENNKQRNKGKNTVSSNCYFAGAQLQIPWFNDVLTSTSLGYSYSHSQLKTKNATGISQGYFHNHTLGTEISCMLPERNFSNLLVRPFVKALGVRASQENFTETGSNIRNFKVKTPLTNVTLPLGIYCHTKNKAHLETSWEFELAYVPTVYREKPQTITSRLISKGTWISSGTHVDRHSGSITIKNTTALNVISLGMNYHGDFSKSTLCNFLNITAQIQF
ncbi:polymorphic outer membrane protein middle domain-containing protein [Chlamydia vaughanii]|uniref:polymorphic outer membrane protein middle domain-containing protein n=1 Tax=Chlamydia vaughanii TaxID=3112552 RepID=UPI0032B24BBE